MKEWIYSAFVLAAAWQDLREKRIEKRLLLLSAAVGGILCLSEWCGFLRMGFFGYAGQESCEIRETVRVAAACVPGVILLLLSRVSQGEIGEGDGCFFLVSAFYLDWRSAALLLLGGLFVCSIYSVLLIVWGRMKGKNMRKVRLPFLPFLVPVWGWMLWSGMSGGMSG